MKLKLLLFAKLKEDFENDSIEIEVKDGSTVQQLMDALAVKYSQIADIRDYLKVSVNLAYAKSDLVIQPNDEVALIPPVSGG